MGLRYLRGLRKVDREKSERARQEGEFVSLRDFIRRTRFDQRRQSLLAEAGAFEAFEKNRRSALWKARGELRAQNDALAVSSSNDGYAFNELDRFETILWDHRTSRHRARGHPLMILREQLVAQRLPNARAVQAMHDGQHVRYVGLVICRQRPSTASGVMFMTLEDETGFVNVVVWKRVCDQYTSILKTQELLGLTGRLQVKEKVVHLVAERCWKPQVRGSLPSVHSRSFH